MGGRGRTFIQTRISRVASCCNDHLIISTFILQTEEEISMEEEAGAAPRSPKNAIPAKCRFRLFFSLFILMGCMKCCRQTDTESIKIWRRSDYNRIYSTSRRRGNACVEVSQSTLPLESHLCVLQLMGFSSTFYCAFCAFFG